MDTRPLVKKQVNIRFCAGDLEYLKGVADDWGVSLSECIRRICFLYRKAYDNNNPRSN